jgi:SnoaL-like domain
MTAAAPHDHLELRAVAERYASGIDRRDAELFVSAFHPDGRLAIHDPGDSAEPVSVVVGHEALRTLTERIARYERTFHHLGNARYEVDGDSAIGEVYCVAHHLTRDRERTDNVMYIRYQDRYRRADDGSWRISERRLVVDWTDAQLVRPRS